VSWLQDHLAACKELQSSKTFQQLLSAVLRVGNFLNHGGRLGNAVGFRLKALNKLHDSRSLDGKSTMLQVGAAPPSRHLGALTIPCIHVDHRIRSSVLVIAPTRPLTGLAVALLSV